MKWDTCVKDYLKMVKNGCPEEFRPTWCKHCESEAKFHKHGSFTRSVLTMEELLEIKIFRFKCTACGKTRSVLPSFLRRHHTAALDVQELVVQSHSKGVALRVISEQLPSQLAFSEKTLWRWKNYWQKLLDNLKLDFWPTVLARFPHLLLPRGSNTPGNRWGLARQLRLAGASRNEMLVKTEGYRRFEAEDAHVIWQSDFQHTLYLPDPQDPKRKKKAMLFAILDDYSRYVVQAQFYWDEKLPRLEDSLKKAILRWGIPEQFYCDNGSVFSSAQLARICGKLGIRLSHSRPYRPAGRGKVERLFRFIDTSFKPEAYQQIEAGQIATLEELNQALAAWLDGYYHLRVHGGTKEKPKARLESSSRKPRRVPMAELTDIFLWQEERKADKAGCIKAQGNLYEVDLELAGKKVLLRYDPFDLSTIQVWHGEKRFQDAVPVDLTRRHHPRVKPEKPKTVPEEGLSFFTAAEARRQQELNKSPLAFEQKEVKVNEQAL